MAVVRITTTRQRDLQPLGTAGQTVVESWSVLSSLLTRELSPKHAALLAEPVVDTARGETDWYGDGDGAPIQITLLDPQLRAEVEAERARLEQDVRTLAARKRADTREGERFLGEMLALALSVPGEAHVYALGRQPVLVAWGHAPAGGTPEQVALTGFTPAAPLPMTILPPPRLPGVASLIRRFLLPAILASLLLPLAALLLVWLDPFGWYVVPPAECHVAPGQLALLGTLHDEMDKEATLRAQLADVTEDAGRRHLQCPPIVVQAPPPPTPPPQPPPPPPPRSADADRAAERGGHSGKLQIILAWEDRNDLDLHVMCPGGAEISFNTKNACGGQLDVDANGDSRTANASPVENVFFEQPAPGTYTVVVDPYAMRVGVDSAFRVTIRRDGQPDKVIRGVAHNGQRRQMVTRVEITPP
jgi:hypothetical protein